MEIVKQIDSRDLAQRIFQTTMGYSTEWIGKIIESPDLIPLS